MLLRLAHQAKASSSSSARLLRSQQQRWLGRHHRLGRSEAAAFVPPPRRTSATHAHSSEELRYGGLLVSPSVEVHVLQPGLVLLRGFLTEREQQRVAAQALDWGDSDDDGFFIVNEHTGEREYNTGEQRGRIYDAASKFPADMISHSARASHVASLADPAMPPMDCTHLLLNMYTSTAGLCWHRDIYENDGSSDHPVVNVNVGATGLFGYKNAEGDPVSVIELRSGDCLLFGGPSRFVWHSVLGVNLADCPEWMAAAPCRLSFTYRDSPEVLGREAEFKYFKVDEHLVGQDQFDGQALVGAHPTQTAAAAAAAAVSCVTADVEEARGNACCG
jgi:alkylated DNA repair dioxygenase AlkB